jgi:hypothetical protein
MAVELKPVLTPSLASRFASLALSHVTREYPNKLDHVMNGPEDVLGPRALHPVFYGSFDWHSCVHGYWLLARLYRRVASFPERDNIRTLFDTHLTPACIAGEIAYLAQPSRGGFERPYGWGWLLMLAGELAQHASDEGKRWSEAMAPLADVFVARWMDFLPKATYPIRAGVHTNTAFAFVLTLDYAAATQDNALAQMVRDRATTWYGEDAACQAWEPSGDDFLSPALIEAECMRRVLPADAFATWFDRFLPDCAMRMPATLFTPAYVSDRTDGKIAHLDGLNLSRSWCWRSIAATLASDDPRRAIADIAAEEHLARGLPEVAGDYMGEHWLATFALLALDV